MTFSEYINEVLYKNFINLTTFRYKDHKYTIRIDKHTTKIRKSEKKARHSDIKTDELEYMFKKLIDSSINLDNFIEGDDDDDKNRVLLELDYGSIETNSVVIFTIKSSIIKTNKIFHIVTMAMNDNKQLSSIMKKHKPRIRIDMRLF